MSHGMLALKKGLIRLSGGGALIVSMGPGRRSLRVAARARAAAASATTTESSGLITPPPPRVSKISKAMLKSLAALNLETQTGAEEPADESEDVPANEEFTRRRRGTSPDGIKRKLDFGAKPLTKARGGKGRANVNPEMADDVVDEVRSASGLRRRKPANDGFVRVKKVKTGSQGEEAMGEIHLTEKQEPPQRVGKRKTKAKVSAPRKGKKAAHGGIAQMEIDGISVEQEFSEEARRPRKKPANSKIDRVKKVKREIQEVEKEVHNSLQQLPSGQCKGDSQDKKSTPEVEKEGKEEGEYTEIGHIVKSEPRREAGPHTRKLQRNVFSKVTKVEPEVDQEEFCITVKQEAGDEVQQRKRKLSDRVSLGSTPVMQEADGHKQAHEAGQEHKSPPALELIRVRPATEAQLASDKASAIIALPGPYPSFMHPFNEECQQVINLLSRLHGHLAEYERHKVSCPTTEQQVYIQPLQPLGPMSPEPRSHGRCDTADKAAELEKWDSTGNMQLALALTGSSDQDAGLKDMVPTGHPRERGTVLDSLVGTLLSQNTTDNNSRKAFAALKLAFPTWEKVLKADQMEVEDVIRCGGLAETKAERIRTILGTLLKERGEISLEYVRSMSNEDIKVELSRFKGIGPKTIACVLMFHLQRTEFPVDTHVFRISKMLGWVPDQADREKAYLHLNQRIPDSLKFDLHVLLVTHGKRCPQCAKRINQQPADGACPLLNWKSKWSRTICAPLELKPM